MYFEVKGRSNFFQNQFHLLNGDDVITLRSLLKTENKATVTLLPYNDKNHNYNNK